MSLTIIKAGIQYATTHQKVVDKIEDLKRSHQMRITEIKGKITKRDSDDKYFYYDIKVSLDHQLKRDSIFVDEDMRVFITTRVNKTSDIVKHKFNSIQMLQEISTFTEHEFES